MHRGEMKRTVRWRRRMRVPVPNAGASDPDSTCGLFSNMEKYPERLRSEESEELLNSLEEENQVD